RDHGEEVGAKLLEPVLLAHVPEDAHYPSLRPKGRAGCGLGAPDRREGHLPDAAARLTAAAAQLTAPSPLLPDGGEDVGERRPVARNLDEVFEQAADDPRLATLQTPGEGPGPVR